MFGRTASGSLHPREQLAPPSPPGRETGAQSAEAPDARPSPTAPARPVEASASAPGTGLRTVIVDTDPAFRAFLARDLNENGYEVVALANGSALTGFFAGGGIADVILLDWHVQDPDGLELVGQLRASGIRTPVIFLSRAGDEACEEAALRNGAIDFIEKSRSLSIIRQRMRLTTSGTAPHSRPGPMLSGFTRCGRLEFRHDGNVALFGGVPVALGVVELHVVRLLASIPDREFSYRQIHAAISDGGRHTERDEDRLRGNVRTLIKRIRQKFRAVDPGFDCIANYRGYGYRWVPGDDGGSVSPILRDRASELANAR